VQKNSTQLVQNGCISADLVEISSCAGTCGTSSMYSAEANNLIHFCSCCQEKKTHPRQVELICPDGSKQKHTYFYIDSCSCHITDCNERVKSPDLINKHPN
uniref:CTCK domain-containing protein n=1 Tax=Denticeps clupeoides TaxID=299321 RepID=A0AAY4ERH7_9TELE